MGTLMIIIAAVIVGIALVNTIASIGKDSIDKQIRYEEKILNGLYDVAKRGEYNESLNSAIIEAENKISRLRRENLKRILNQ